MTSIVVTSHPRRSSIWQLEAQSTPPPPTSRPLMSPAIHSSITADTPSSIDARIASIQNMKLALCLVLDREIASLKIKRNTLSPISRLPDEILVHIIKVVQGRHDALGISSPFDLPFKKTARQPKWRHLLWTCSHFRSVALSHPELWAYVDTRWPRRWLDLCIQRAGEYPLFLHSRVMDQASAVLTTSCLRKSQDATIYIHDYESAWSKSTGALLEIPCPLLRWLTLKNLRSRKWVLTRKFLAGQCPSLLTLAFEQVHMEYIPELPNLRSLRAVESTLPLRWEEVLGLPNLRYLRLEECSLPFHSDQAAQFFRSMPRLEEAEMLRIKKSNIQVVADDLTAYTRVVLPHLTRLHITGSIITVWLVLQVLPCPRKQLNVGVSPSSIDGHAALRLTKDVLMYAKQFWACVSGNRELQFPPAVLRPRPMHSNGFSSVYIELTDKRRVLGREAVFSATMWSNPIGPEEAFLPLVTEVDINADSSPMESIWPILDGVTELEKLNVWSREPRTLMVTLQSWANERASQGRGPVSIELNEFRNENQ